MPACSSRRLRARRALGAALAVPALAWRDQLRSLGVEAACVADHPLDRFGRGDIYLAVPPNQWSEANEVLENLD